jgi:hypothetical protein
MLHAHIGSGALIGLSRSSSVELEAAGSTGTAAVEVLASARELSHGAQALNRELIELLHGIRAA